MVLKIIGTGSKGNAYLLENEQEALLIECGVKIADIKKALNFNLSKISGCIVTHEHLDHCKAVNEVMNCGISVYASKGTIKHFPYNNTGRYPLIMESKCVYKIGNFKVLPFDVKHDASEPLGFLIEHSECGRVLFLTDTFYCKYNFPSLNNIIIEANYSKEIIDRNFGRDSDKEFLRNRILKSHMSLDHCKQMLAANDLTEVNNIVLIHLSDSNSNEIQFKNEVQNLTGKNVTVASNGMQLKFKKTPF